MGCTSCGMKKSAVKICKCGRRYIGSASVCGVCASKTPKPAQKK